MTKTTKTVRVTSAQKTAARALVSRSAKTGRYISPAVSKIANAKSTTRSAVTGRYVAGPPGQDDDTSVTTNE